MDDFSEEDDTIFGEDEVFDCILLEKMEKKQGYKKNSNQGCLGTVIILVGVLSAMTFGLTKFIIWWGMVAGLETAAKPFLKLFNT